MKKISHIINQYEMGRNNIKGNINKFRLWSLSVKLSVRKWQKVRSSFDEFQKIAQLETRIAYLCEHLVKN